MRPSTRITVQPCAPPRDPPNNTAAPACMPRLRAPMYATSESSLAVMIARRPTGSTPRMKASRRSMMSAFQMAAVTNPIATDVKVKYNVLSNRTPSRSLAAPPCPIATRNSSRTAGEKRTAAPAPRAPQSARRTIDEDRLGPPWPRSRTAVEEDADQDAGLARPDTLGPVTRAPRARPRCWSSQENATPTMKDRRVFVVGRIQRSTALAFHCAGRRA